ncbi:MAG: hypothetical protein QNK11_09645 [Legionella sp.]|nr:hypothetical protein [Legionella sp.]
MSLAILTDNLKDTPIIALSAIRSNPEALSCVSHRLQNHYLVQRFVKSVLLEGTRAERRVHAAENTSLAAEERPEELQLDKLQEEAESIAVKIKQMDIRNPNRFHCNHSNNDDMELSSENTNPPTNGG